MEGKQGRWVSKGGGYPREVGIQGRWVSKGGGYPREMGAPFMSNSSGLKTASKDLQEEKEVWHSLWYLGSV